MDPASEPPDLDTRCFDSYVGTVRVSHDSDRGDPRYRSLDRSLYRRASR